jgi:hypothetical protein
MTPQRAQPMTLRVPQEAAVIVEVQAATGLTTSQHVEASATIATDACDGSEATALNVSPPIEASAIAPNVVEVAAVPLHLIVK